MSKERNKINGRGGRVLSLIKDSISLPSDAVAGSFAVELRGRGSLTVEGCRRIIKYSTEEMILAANDFQVHIVGERLVCTVFHGGSITVEGRVCGISFSEDKGDGK